MEVLSPGIANIRRDRTDIAIVLCSGRVTWDLVVERAKREDGERFAVGRVEEAQPAVPTRPSSRERERVHQRKPTPCTCNKNCVASPPTSQPGFGVPTVANRPVHSAPVMGSAWWTLPIEVACTRSMAPGLRLLTSCTPALGGTTMVEMPSSSGPRAIVVAAALIAVG